MIMINKLKDSLKSCLSELKNNPLVDGIVLEESVSDEYERYYLYIVYNDSPVYIKQTTGVDFFSKSDSIRNKIDNLYWKKRGYEGAIESPDIVPGEMELHAEVNRSAANAAASEMDALKSILSDVHELENKEYTKFMREYMNSLDSTIIKLKLDYRYIYIDKTKRCIFRSESASDKAYVRPYILFNRTNRIMRTPDRPKIMHLKDRIV